MSFTRNIDELLYLTGKKENIARHLKKNYKAGVHYIVEKTKYAVKQNGGQNKMDYLLTEEAFELLKNSYNLRNRYIVNVSGNVQQLNLCMCIENQTIGFIENSYKDALNVKRQFAIENYKADLYFIDHKLVVECDEFNHKDRDAEQEKIREKYILSLGNKIIRYNPNDNAFDLSDVLKKINVILFSNTS
jgi:very-short-patch-repair endonuclease